MENRDGMDSGLRDEINHQLEGMRETSCPFAVLVLGAVLKYDMILRRRFPERNCDPRSDAGIAPYAKTGFGRKNVHLCVGADAYTGPVGTVEFRL